MVLFQPPSLKSAPILPDVNTDSGFGSLAEEFHPHNVASKISAKGLLVGDLMFHGLIEGCGRFTKQWITLKRKLSSEEHMIRMMRTLYDAVTAAAERVGSGR